MAPMFAWSSRRLNWILAAIATLLVLFPACVLYAADPETHVEARITVELQDRSLSEALETVAEMVGQRLEVSGDMGERKVSVVLRGATLQESLERILQPLDFIIEWLPKNRVTVYLLDREGSNAEAPVKAREPIGGFADINFSARGDDGLPLSHLDVLLITSADMEFYNSFRTYIDPVDMEVFPPSSPEVVGPTQAEIEFQSVMHQTPDPADMELFPPESEDGVGLTLAEFEETRSSRPGLPPSQIESFPPVQLGESGLTLKEPNQ